MKRRIPLNNTFKNLNTLDEIKLGVLGKSLPHSLSPRIHSYILDKLGISGNYRKYEVLEEEIPNIIPMMIQENILGLNVTIPYKETLFHLVDKVDEHANAIGAINTIKIQDGLSYGYNTDYLGVIWMFKNANISLRDKDIVILGSGGSAKALIYAFHLEGAAKITVVARNHKASCELKQQFPTIELCKLKDFIKKSPKGDIIVNTTPVGQFPQIDESPIPNSSLSGFKIAGDIVYNPLMTTFLKLAEKQNLITVTGLSMLINQAIAAQEIWLERKIDYSLSSEIEDLLVFS
jgi:shikimate dehydrogenase